MATRSEIEQVKDRLSIVEVVQSYIKLHKAGRNFKALCPFHSEKTPSFMVNPALGIYKCFGCQEGGDIFEFVQKIENCDFGEALKTLAQRAGVKLTSSQFGSSDTSQKDKYFELNALAAKLFNFFLTDHKVGQRAREYLTKREISKETIKKFNLGYAPDAWDTLVKFLPQKGYTLSSAETLGLILQSTQGKGYYDRFRGRLMFPIYDTRNKVVGFSGRVLSKDAKGAKYLNSPDSLLFHKGQLFYGINLAQGPARLADEIHIVEGNVDILTLHQKGIENVVAPLGTALTADHIKLITRMVKKVYLAFDADSAGAKATLRSIELIENKGIEARIISLPEGLDPDACVRKDFSLWTKAKAGALPVLEYQLETIYAEHDLTSGLGKSEAAAKALGLIDQLASEVSKNHYIQIIAQKLGTSTDALRAELQKKSSQAPQTKDALPVSPSAILAEYDSTELEILRIFLQYPDLIKPNIQESQLEFSDQTLLDILHELTCQAGGEFDLKNFYAKLEDIQKQIVTQLVFANSEEDKTRNEQENDLDALIRRLEKKNIERQLTILSGQIAQMEADGQDEQTMKLLTKQQELKEKLASMA